MPRNKTNFESLRDNRHRIQEAKCKTELCVHCGKDLEAVGNKINSGGGGGGKALTMTMTPWNLAHGQW